MKTNRRLLFLLVPIFLLGANFWVRDAAWKKTEADFRRDVVTWTSDVSLIQVSAVNSEAFPQFKDGIWDIPDFLSTVKAIRLTRAQSRFPKAESLPLRLRTEPYLFVSLDSGASIGSTNGFYLSLKEDRGWMDIYSKDGANWQDKGYGHWILRC